MKSKDRIGGIVLAAIGLIAFIMSSGIKQGVNLSEPGPRLFPRIAAVGIMICGIIIALQAKPEEEKPYLDKDGWKRLLIAMLAMLAYYFGLTWFGFLLATPFFTFAIINILANGKKLNQVLTVVIALITTIGLYVVFQKLFVILLPAGTVLKSLGINLMF
ncbi:MAG: tripartite tricarboxylate transporter TctB family protein [Lachnospiraceae bacterium]|nr:tripartite tricarboxylate transporter TctB family protein [Lachnospiraceae bacterium]